MFDCSENWKSVRKVRYLVDIYSSLKFALENEGKSFSRDLFRNFLIQGRRTRLELIHKHYRSVKYTPMDQAILDRKNLRVTIPDTLTFLKNIGIFKVQGEKVVAMPLPRQIEKTATRNESNLKIAEAILNSKYAAYQCFLLQLNQCTSLKIPKSRSYRDEHFRSFLQAKGFNTDVASFYTIRDLFYELELVNWYVDPDGNERIYPTAVLSTNNQKLKTWQLSTRLNSLKLFYLRRISIQNFSKALELAYLRYTNRRFDREADLLPIRDYVCEKLQISDHQFAELIQLAKKEPKTNLSIVLSFGSILDRKKNYGLKIFTLPQISSKRLALYIRLRRLE